MFCPHCEAPFDENARYCANCGGAVATPAGAAATAAGTEMRDLYEAFIGPAKAHYYLPRFEAFDKGEGPVSWNWPAALVPQWWTLYRGMFLWGLLLYPILSSIAPFLLMMLLLNLIGEAGIWGLGLGMLISMTAMGLFGNKLFHRHVSGMIARSGRLGLTAQQRREWLIRKGSVSYAFYVIMIFVVVMILGMVASIALPAYQNYVTRAKVAEGLANIGRAKAAYQAYVMGSRGWPASMDDVGLPERTADYGASVASVTIGSEHELRISFLVPPVIDGQTIVLTPAVEGDSLVWSCRTETMEDRYAPVECRW